MYNENYVIFKGTKDGVTVIFDPEVSFETLCTQLEKKVAEAGKFFDNVKTSLAFKGRVFTEEEEETLLKIIAKHTTMEITFVKTENNEIKRLSDLLEKEGCQPRCRNQGRRQYHHFGAAQGHGTRRLQGHDGCLCFRHLYGTRTAAHCGYHHPFSRRKQKGPQAP